MANTPEPNSEDPFSGIPFLGDIAKAMSGQGPINWDAARQFALLGATGGEQEPNVDPASRMALEALVPIARMHVGDLTGADLSTTDVVTCSRSQWAADTLDSYRPLFTDLATALSGATGVDEDATDPMAQMMAGLSKMMAPAMLGMAVGSMTGDLAQRCFGVHDLPIPRIDQRLKLIGANIDAFAAQWEIPLDEVRLWVLAHEFAGQAVLSSPNFATPLSTMVRQYVAAFRPDPDAVIEKLGGLDPTSADPMEAIQQTLGDPAILLGAVSSEAQREMEPRLDAAVAAVVGFTDWIVDAVSVRVVGGSRFESLKRFVANALNNLLPMCLFIACLAFDSMRNKFVAANNSCRALLTGSVTMQRLRCCSLATIAAQHQAKSLRLACGSHGSVSRNGHI